MRKNYYQMTTADRTADIYIFGDITSWEWLESDVSSYTLARQLQDLNDVDKINVFINSYGGEVAEATAIHNQLKAHPAKVTTVCDGFACSAASVIFMAGDERLMNKASRLMIHPASKGAYGTASQLRKAADDLESITDLSVVCYMDKVNIPEERLRELMEAETWIRPEEAVEMAFATGIRDEAEGDNPTQSARMAVMMALDKLGGNQPPAEPKKPEKKKPENKILKLFERSNA